MYRSQVLKEQGQSCKTLEIPFGNNQESMFFPLIDIGDGKFLLKTKTLHEDLIETLDNWSRIFSLMNEAEYKQYIKIRTGIERLDNRMNEQNYAYSDYELSPFESMTSSQLNKTINKITPIIQKKADKAQEPIIGLDFLKENIVEFKALSKYEKREVQKNLVHPMIKKIIGEKCKIAKTVCDYIVDLDKYEVHQILKTIECPKIFNNAIQDAINKINESKGTSHKPIWKNMSFMN